jgi:membrane-bound serine protease (ClpP class)
VKRPVVVKTIRIILYLVLLAGGLLLSGWGGARAQEAGGAVYLVEIEGVINPPVADYLERALNEAAVQDAALIVILLDTPGGLETSMRFMMQDILASPVPVVVYVNPAGARAASAGLFVLTAGHIAAMTPETNTGAAHPVGLSGETDEVSSAKATNDAAATIRALATERGRNPEWAEQAVRESVSITAHEALELNVIEIVATDVDDLLRQIDGQTVTTAAGEVTLQVSGAPRVDFPMTFAERILHVISDPNIAFILLSVGGVGLIAELYNPGTFIPGVIGLIALILAFFSLGNLPTNWAGVALIGLALALFIGELYTEGTGFMGFGAVVAFLLGGLILFRPIQPVSPVLPRLGVDPWVIGLTTAMMAGSLVFVVRQIVRSRREPIRTGYEHFIGQAARVHRDLEPRGRVWFDGQTWNAELRQGGSAPAGSSVQIVGLDGLTLIVEKIDEDVILKGE